MPDHETVPVAIRPGICCRLSHQDAMEYLREENRVLLEQLGDRRIRLTDQQRRRVAAKAKVLGRKTLMEIADCVTSDTLLRRYRKLVSEEYDGKYELW